MLINRFGKTNIHPDSETYQPINLYEDFDPIANAIKEESHDDHHDDHGHGHGHHHKEYDWRDDPKYNNDLYQDLRDLGIPDPVTMASPYDGVDHWRTPFPSPSVNLDDITINIRAENQKYDVYAEGTLRPPYYTLSNDIAHEADYESEDFDF